MPSALIHCLKTNLHCHTDELSGEFRRWHTTSYPVAEVLNLYQRKGFSALAVTEHIAESSVESNDLLADLLNGSEGGLVHLRGEENSVENRWHVVSILDGDKELIKILCHPVRTGSAEDLVETATRLCREQGIEAVELDMLAAGEPGIRAQYEELRRKSDIPIICNSDFHTDIFQQANHFTVYLCEDRTPAGIVKALRAGAYVGFYPDVASWEMQTWVGASPLAREWMADAGPERFSHAFSAFARVDPPVRFGQMGRPEIEAFHGCRGEMLKDGDLSVLILPERGGRIAGIWIDGVQMVDPILNAALDVESGAEIFEAGFSAYKVLESDERNIVMERKLVDRPEFAGLIFRKRYALRDGRVHVSSVRTNASNGEIRCADHLRYRFFKDFGDGARIVIEDPTPIAFTLPINGKVECAGGCRYTVHGAGYAMGVRVQDERLESLSVWSRSGNAYALTILNYRENALAPGESSAAYEVVLEPRLESM